MTGRAAAAIHECPVKGERLCGGCRQSLTGLATATSGANTLVNRGPILEPRHDRCLALVEDCAFVVNNGRRYALGRKLGGTIMAEEDTAALAALIKRLHGVDLPPERWRDALAMVERSGALARKAAGELPFGAEPAGFDHEVVAAAAKGGRHG